MEARIQMVAEIRRIFGDTSITVSPDWVLEALIASTRPGAAGDAPAIAPPPGAAEPVPQPTKPLRLPPSPWPSWPRESPKGPLVDEVRRAYGGDTLLALCDDWVLLELVSLASRGRSGNAPAIGGRP